MTRLRLRISLRVVAKGLLAPWVVPVGVEVQESLIIDALRASATSDKLRIPVCDSLSLDSAKNLGEDRFARIGITISKNLLANHQRMVGLGLQRGCWQVHTTG